MKKRLLASVVVSLLAGTASAQSVFQGFYGQLSTGYENNTIANSSPTITGQISATGQGTGTSSNGNVPLIAGLGYTFSLTPQYTLGLGADYSFLNQNTSNISTNWTGGASGNSGNYNYQISNRANIYVTPGYVLNKDALVYLKAGYSMENLQAKVSGGGSNSNTATASGYIVGLGYKQMITSGIYGFAEGNYMSYSKPQMTSSIAAGTNVNFNPGAPSAYQILVGVGYKF
ncbi:outer membrane protein [Polynucleobacter sp. AP-Kolm-20A-A1]|uniref:outer membrane protein n=1 Tax=Polynucleobacter sp. AP-Kolm-20A-A1 TaxID=2081041 RepID=UPI001BFE24EA|nr:outer membrane beta-barrel protein [Polynucleobacter sp. AP-Kolm-20A-A1]QWE20409.1 porin family protein [Polynucleobacter sp. AP-Kolm-20A-A1]